MKTKVLSIVAAMAAGAAVAAANDVLITFSTPGPDKYADGKTVMDGERYALCWSKDFANFKINKDGTGEGGAVVLKAPVAKDGKCPTVVFEIDADYADANFQGGEWAVYLLDTRKFAADGTAKLAAAATSVNTAGIAGAKVSVGTGSVATLSGAAATAGEVAAGVEVPQPEITGIKVEDGNVIVSVKGTVPFLAYGLAEGETPDAVVESVGAAKPGKVAAEDEIYLVAPAKAAGGFFRVKKQ